MKRSIAFLLTLILSIGMVQPVTAAETQEESVTEQEMQGVSENPDMDLMMPAENVSSAETEFPPAEVLNEGDVVFSSEETFDTEEIYSPEEETDNGGDNLPASDDGMVEEEESDENITELEETKESEEGVELDETADDEEEFLEAEEVDLEEDLQNASNDLLNGSLFTNSTQYNKNLAIASATLCYNVGDVSAYFPAKNHKRYSIKSVGSEVFQMSIGYKKITVNGKDRNLVAVVFRGTGSVYEAILDACNKYPVNATNPFEGQNAFSAAWAFEKEAEKNLKEFLESHSSVWDNPVVFLVTGYSIGGAGANLLGAKLTNNYKQSNVFVYTFGAIKAINTTLNVEDGYSNIHNIYNYNDSFGPHGNYAYLGVSDPFYKFGSTYFFIYDHENGPTLNNHDMQVYLNAVKGDAVYISPTIQYRTHVQSFGWQGWKKNGELSGTFGLSKRLEGIEIKVSKVANLGIRYKTHIQHDGWESSWKSNGQMSGTSGQAKRLEAIKIELTGGNSSKYDIWYCVHAQHYGWLNWAKNGASAGTEGYAYRLEAIKIKILPKGAPAPKKEGSYTSAFYSKNTGPSTDNSKTGVAYNTHVQTYGWQDYAYNGSMAGTSGQSKRLEGIHISLVNPKYSGDIQYRTHIQSIGWQGWKKNGEMSGTSGQSKRLEAIQIQLTGDMANKYDIYYRVHAQKFGWMGWAKNGASAGTAGYSYRLEAIQIKLVTKGGKAPGSTAVPFKQKDSEKTTYARILKEYESKYGRAKKSNANGYSAYSKGVHFADLKDLNGDRSNELIIIYYASGSNGVTNWYVDVWKTKGGTKKYELGGCYLFSGMDVHTFVFYTYGNKKYLVSGLDVSDTEKQLYGFMGSGDIGIVKRGKKWVYENSGAYNYIDFGMGRPSAIEEYRLVYGFGSNVLIDKLQETEKKLGI